MIQVLKIQLKSKPKPKRAKPKILTPNSPFFSRLHRLRSPSKRKIKPKRPFSPGSQGTASKKRRSK